MLAALLAWLALEGPTPRMRLAQLLWPDSEPEAARNALRQRLFQLRRQLGTELVSGSTTLALAEGVSHDLHDSDSVLGDAAHAFGAELAAWLSRGTDSEGPPGGEDPSDLLEDHTGGDDASTGDVDPGQGPGSHAENEAQLEEPEPDRQCREPRSRRAASRWQALQAAAAESNERVSSVACSLSFLRSTELQRITWRIVDR